MNGNQPEPWSEPIYLDASALVKLLVPEPESDALNEALVGSRNVIVSELALTEMTSALGRRTREKRLTPASARRLHREAHRLAAACRRVEITPPVHRRAERLLLGSQQSPLRALDALHIALALGADAATFVTFDERLRHAAAARDLFVAPATDG